MKYCIHCGRQLEDSVVICPYCGAVQPGAIRPKDDGHPQAGTAPRQDAGDASSGGVYSAENRSGTGGAASGGPSGGYRSGAGPYNPYDSVSPGNGCPSLPSATPYLVWSIILIVLFWPLGIPATVFSAMAKSDHDYRAVQEHIKTAKILCIVGTCIAGAYLLIILSFIALSLLMAALVV